jgi:hypothetical protein
MLAAGCRTAAKTDAARKPAAPMDLTAIDTVLAQADTIELYKLTPVERKTFLKGGWREVIAPYPIDSGPIPFDKEIMDQLVAIARNPASYDRDAKLGCGYFRWRYLLKIAYAGKHAEILIEPNITFVAIIQNGYITQVEFMGNAYDEFKDLWQKLIIQP